MFTVEFESNNQEQPSFDDRILGIENPAACASIAPTAGFSQRLRAQFHQVVVAIPRRPEIVDRPRGLVPDESGSLLIR